MLENDNGELALWSRNGRPLLRYFPELREVGELLPPHSALDGEIVIARDGKLDFDAMQTRLHPAESRVRKLSGEIPATFVAFDLLLWKGKPVHEQPIEKRRAQLEKVANGIALSPVSEDVEQGRAWLQTLQAAGFDGVIAKKLGLPYLPGLARRRREGEAVQDGGLRRRRRALQEGRPHDDRDAAARPVCRRRPPRLRRLGRGRREAHDEIAALVLPLIDEKSDRHFSEPNRWGTGELEEQALKPKLVVEVRFDKLEKRRFRHGTKLVRFRADKDPDQCTWREVRPPRKPGDLSVDAAAGTSTVQLRVIGCSRRLSPSSSPARLHALRLARHLREVRRIRRLADALPTPRARPTRAARAGRTPPRRCPSCRSPSSAKRGGIVAIVKSSISTSGSSSQRTGADTVASGRPRTEYAERIVRSRAFWL